MRPFFNYRQCATPVWSRRHICRVVVVVLLIPGFFGFLSPLSGQAISPEQSAQIPADNYGCSGFYHTVQPGETIYSIAVRYGTTAYRIAVCNGRYSYRVYVGNTLLIPRYSPYRRGITDNLKWPTNSIAGKFAGESSAP